MLGATKEEKTVEHYFWSRKLAEEQRKSLYKWSPILYLASLSQGDNESFSKVYIAKRLSRVSYLISGPFLPISVMLLGINKGSQENKKGKQGKHKVDTKTSL